MPQTKSSAIIMAAAVVVVIYGMQMMSVLLVPFLVAAFLALITVRPMLWLQAHRVPSVLAALLIVTMLMLILVVVGAILGTSIADFTAALPTYQARLDALNQQAFEFVVKHLKVDESTESMSDMIDPGFAMGLVAGILNGLRDVLTNTFLIIFTMIFILLEAGTAKTKFQAAFGRSADSLQGARDFMQNLGRYLGIKTLVSMATGMCAGLLTWALDVDFPLLWAMFAFLLNYVPTIGSIIAAVPAVLLALIQIGPGAAGATAMGFIGINLVFGNFLEPRLMGYGVGISPLVVFVGLIAWGWIFGPVGMLLSVPLTMTLKMALENDDRTRWVAILLGSERDAEHALRERERAKAADQATSS
ncbi:MAG: AI-2E family transporter [Gammaproteobacteria bacterium]|nr:AI-2E family transporter [Gammaproteobacteria bacterium]MDH3860413.1 AI-2E family transporter [Gammaproteobacteria bacterium]